MNQETSNSIAAVAAAAAMTGKLDSYNSYAGYAPGMDNSINSASSHLNNSVNSYDHSSASGNLNTVNSGSYFKPNDLYPLPFLSSSPYQLTASNASAAFNSSDHQSNYFQSPLATDGTTNGASTSSHHNSAQASFGGYKTPILPASSQTMTTPTSAASASSFYSLSPPSVLKPVALLNYSQSLKDLKTANNQGTPTSTHASSSGFLMNSNNNTASLYSAGTGLLAPTSPANLPPPASINQHHPQSHYTPSSASTSSSSSNPIVHHHGHGYGYQNTSSSIESPSSLSSSSSSMSASNSSNSSTSSSSVVNYNEINNPYYYYNYLHHHHHYNTSSSSSSSSHGLAGSNNSSSTYNPSSNQYNNAHSSGSNTANNSSYRKEVSHHLSPTLLDFTFE